MYDIIGIGECLIDFTPVKDGSLRYPAFEQNPGGAPANMVGSASLLGAKTAFIGKVGKDQFGAFLISVLEQIGVGTEGIVQSAANKTSLAFVHLFDDGQREFDFYRDADLCLLKTEINWDMIRNTKLLHISSLAFCSEEMTETTYATIKFAKENGVLISYDANWRPALWADQAHGKKMLKAGVGFSDMIKVSEEELTYITGIKDEKTAATALISQGVPLVMVTKGPLGTSVYTKNAAAGCPAVAGIKPVDTTGAGDACFGSFVWAFLKSGKKIDALTADDLSAFQKTANVVAGLSVGKRGGISSLPTARELDASLNGQG